MSDNHFPIPIRVEELDRLEDKILNAIYGEPTLETIFALMTNLLYVVDTQTDGNITIDRIGDLLKYMAAERLSKQGE